MKSNSNLARIDECVCIEDLSNINEEKFKDIISYDFYGYKIPMQTSQIKYKSISIMLFHGRDNRYSCHLEIYKLNNKIYSKYIKFNDMNEHFIRIAKSPILHEGKIQSDEIPDLKIALKTKFDDNFIDLVCDKLDEFAKMIDSEQKIIEEQPKILKKIKQ